jgi:hypothetical protein
VVVPVVVDGATQPTPVHQLPAEKKVTSQVDLVSSVRLLAGNPYAPL